MLGSGPRGTRLRLIPSSLRDGAAPGRADLSAPETKRSRQRPRRRRSRGDTGCSPPRPPGRGQRQAQHGAPGSAALGSRRRAGGIGIGFLPPHPLPAKLFRVGLRRAAQAPQQLAASSRPRLLWQGGKYTLIALKKIKRIEICMPATRRSQPGDAGAPGSFGFWCLAADSSLPRKPKFPRRHKEARTGGQILHSASTALPRGPHVPQPVRGARGLQTGQAPHGGTLEALRGPARPCQGPPGPCPRAGVAVPEQLRGTGRDAPAQDTPHPNAQPHTSAPPGKTESQKLPGRRAPHSAVTHGEPSEDQGCLISALKSPHPGE